MRFDQLPEDVQEAIRAKTEVLVEDLLTEEALWQVLVKGDYHYTILGRAYALLFTVPNVKSRLLNILSVNGCQKMARVTCEDLLAYYGHYGDEQLLRVDEVLRHEETLDKIKEILQ